MSEGIFDLTAVNSEINPESLNSGRNNIAGINISYSALHPSDGQYWRDIVQAVSLNNVSPDPEPVPDPLGLNPEPISTPQPNSSFNVTGYPVDSSSYAADTEQSVEGSTLTEYGERLKPINNDGHYLYPSRPNATWRDQRQSYGDGALYRNPNTGQLTIVFEGQQFDGVYTYGNGILTDDEEIRQVSELIGIDVSHVCVVYCRRPESLPVNTTNQHLYIFSRRVEEYKVEIYGQEVIEGEISARTVAVFYVYNNPNYISATSTPVATLTPTPTHTPVSHAPPAPTGLPRELTNKIFLNIIANGAEITTQQH